MIAQCKKRHRHHDFAFLNWREVPPDLEIHLVVDNYATHKHPRVRAWELPRYHLHFTRT